VHRTQHLQREGSKYLISVREIYNKTEITFSEVFKRGVCVCVCVCGVGRAHVQSNITALNDL